MSFLTDRDTGFLMPPSADEWPSERRLAGSWPRSLRASACGDEGPLPRRGGGVLPPAGLLGIRVHGCAIAYSPAAN